MDSLSEKVAVVTGGANGLGLGLAEAFAEEGMRVVLADVDEPALDRAVADFIARGVPAIGVPTDVSDPSAVEQLRDVAYERFGTAHVLCNNAGIGGRSPLSEPIDLTVWESVFGVDCFAILHGLNAFLPRMLEQREGHVVNTSSRQGLVAAPNLGPYPPAKHASVAITEMLREELAAIGSPVGTTVLTPGGVRTPLIVEALARYQRGELTDPAMQEFLETRVANAVEPIAVGRLVVRAIRQDVLYVNTHRETLDWLQSRVDRIVADADVLGTLR
jgi:NAD(P)-dependent dehydrogenase (short-subunit alcohol dehydrogenase family)